MNKKVVRNLWRRIEKNFGKISSGLALLRTSKYLVGPGHPRTSARHCSQPLSQVDDDDDDDGDDGNCNDDGDDDNDDDNELDEVDDDQDDDNEDDDEEEKDE